MITNDETHHLTTRLAEDAELMATAAIRNLRDALPTLRSQQVLHLLDDIDGLFGKIDQVETLVGLARTLPDTALAHRHARAADLLAREAFAEASRRVRGALLGRAGMRVRTVTSERVASEGCGDGGKVRL